MLDQRIIEIIKEGKGFVAILAGSGSDEPHIEKIVKSIETYKIPYGVNILSAHKQTDRVKKIVLEYNKLSHPLLLVAVAGGTDALSGTLSWYSHHPTISCTPDGLNESCLKNPSGSSNSFILRPDNLAKYAAQMFSHLNPRYAELLQLGIGLKVTELELADTTISKKYLDRMLKVYGGN